MKTRTPLIFVVEDDPIFNRLISSFLVSKNIGTVKSFHSGESCLGKIEEKPDIVILDYNLPDKTGLETLLQIKRHSPQTGCIFLSGQSEVKVGVDALKAGAFDYIVKDEHAKDNTLSKVLEFLKLRKTLSDKETMPTKDSSMYL